MPDGTFQAVKVAPAEDSSAANVNQPTAPQVQPAQQQAPPQQQQQQQTSTQQQPQIMQGMVLVQGPGGVQMLVPQASLQSATNGQQNNQQPLQLQVPGNQAASARVQPPAQPPAALAQTPATYAPSQPPSMAPPGGGPAGVAGGPPPPMQEPVAPPAKPAAPAVPPNACETLYVDDVPLDMSKRELAHIFRPFGGFKVCQLP